MSYSNTSIATGVDFEQYIKNLMLNEGIQVSDTPASNDYGADLIADLNGFVFAIQCKYYTDTVGVHAVQEVVASLNYYKADYGVVVTNSTFTQQAKNLAHVNGVLLLDGNFLSQRNTSESFTNALSSLSDSNQDSYQYNATSSLNSDEWTLDDLMIRYRASESSIKRNYMSAGLPYYKVGREYRFNPEEVKKWELEKKVLSGTTPSGFIKTVNNGDSIEMSTPLGYSANIIRCFLPEVQKYMLHEQCLLDRAKELNDEKARDEIEAEVQCLGFGVDGWQLKLSQPKVNTQKFSRQSIPKVTIILNLIVLVLAVIIPYFCCVQAALKFIDNKTAYTVFVSPFTMLQIKWEQGDTLSAITQVIVLIVPGIISFVFLVINLLKKYIEFTD